MSHSYSVFTNSCIRVPLDPVSKMPKTAYERKKSGVTEQCSIDSPSAVCSASAADIDAVKLKDFYRSIPDYTDINHLSAEEFYLTLKSLRDKKNLMFGIAIEHIDDSNGYENKLTDSLPPRIHNSGTSALSKCTKSKLNSTLRRNYSTELRKASIDSQKKYVGNSDDAKIAAKTVFVGRDRKTLEDLEESQGTLKKATEQKVSSVKQKGLNKTDGSKRNHSACSITWNDDKIDNKYEIDEKFEQFFLKPFDANHVFKTQSMPSSPLRSRARSPDRKYKNITLPKPFKMTERDEEERRLNELRSLRKSFSADALHQKYKRKHFKANPVPIESRIPLYDKILEDQAMRRAITKINSEAELRAQMKPFSFTRREQEGALGICERASQILPKTKKKKRFKARPVPKNLFSNYFYDKMKEDEFFRNVNRRIRAEELLRAAHLPGSMATRERSRLSTPGAHSDLPIDPSPAVPSVTSSDKQRPKSPTKNRKRREKIPKEEFVTTSPKPFRFSTADRAAKKMQDVAKKLYLESKSSVSMGGSDAARAYSALELRAAASGRSNLAALLRAEAVRRRFELETASRLAEHRRKTDMRQRDRLLRSNPAWHLVKNNHEEDIAMRLQTRRDEERMRREEFLHEMELMYGRVQQQPLLFERYYAPRSDVAPIDCIQLSPRKHTGRKINSIYRYTTSPGRSRKVSINDNTETYHGNVLEYLNRIENDDKLSSDSDVAIDG